MCDALPELSKNRTAHYFTMSGVYALLNEETPSDAFKCPLCGSGNNIYTVIDSITKPHRALSCYECGKKGLLPPDNMKVYAAVEYYTDSSGPYPVKRRRVTKQPNDKDVPDE